MADTTTNKCPISVIATKSDRIKDLSVKNGQLIFLQDVGRIAMDFNNVRVFYNQITELKTNEERLTLSNPLSGYYFVIETATLWFYQNNWIQITSEPDEVVFVGVELPELGQKNKIYVNTAEREISVWSDSENKYIEVANYTEEITAEEVEDLFDDEN